jgi:hypothetical protein
LLLQLLLCFFQQHFQLVPLSLVFRLGAHTTVTAEKQYQQQQ